MKKLTTLLLVACFTIFLAACGNTATNNNGLYPTTEPNPTEATSGTHQWPPLQLSISFLMPENTVTIETNRPLYNFEWVRLESDFAGDEVFFIAKPNPLSEGSAVELMPDEPFVINNFMDDGSLPTNAVTFIDEYGERRYFAFSIDNSMGIEPSPFVPGFLNSVVNGRVRIDATRGDGSRWDLGYFNVDVNNFDPETWFTANSYRWAAYTMVMWEMQNVR